jgi:L,D-peptidoglycan transpeptidase YkuD (ErfK/YbiS/YcfS/YnhG family)
VLPLFALAVAGCGGQGGPPRPPVSAATQAAPAAASESPGPAAAPDGSAALGAHPTSTAPAPARATSGTPAAATSENDASRLRSLPAATTQVIIVQAAGQSATTASLATYAKSGGAWRPALPAMSARIGGNGFSDNKREGDRTTPAGVFAIDATMYGIAADPGVRYRYHRLVPDDWWNENSDSPGYNTFSHGPNPGGPSEPLWQISPQYNHFAVIRYNMPATPGRGSGIFLHQSTANSTLGCVSLAAGDLTAVLRWLDPAASPRIVLAPTAWLGRY